GRALEGVGRGLSRSRVWQDDMDDDRTRDRDRDRDRRPRVEPIEPVHIEPLEPSRLRRVAPTKVPYSSALLRERMPRNEMMSAAAMRDGAANSAALDIAGLRLVPVGAELATYLGK